MELAETHGDELAASKWTQNPRAHEVQSRVRPDGLPSDALRFAPRTRQDFETERKSKLPPRLAAAR